MDKETAISFGIFDYCMFALMLIISSGICFYISYKGRKSPEEFLTGSRSFNPLPAAMSLLTSLVSSISLLGYSGEVYASGTQLSMVIFGTMLGIIFSSYFLLPAIYPLEIISANEYIELRFKSKGLCFVVFLSGLIRITLASSAALYGATIAIASLTKLSPITNIVILGSICTIYSSFGGIKGIMWTDVFQLTTMLIGLVTIFTVGVIQNGGIIETLYIANKGGRIEFFNVNPSPFVRYTLFNTIAYGLFAYSFWYGMDQMNFQRICSVKSLKSARRVLSYNVYGMFLVYFLIFSCGLVAYASYAGCDPMALRVIKKKDEILPYFVMDKLSVISGLPGIFVAAITGASLSSVSSCINSIVAWIWRDVFLKFNHFRTASASYATMTNKIISLVTGSVITCLSIPLSKAGGLAQVMLTVFGTFIGPAWGIFLIGFFLPRCNIKGVWTGYILSSVLTTWLALGGLYYKKPPKMLPFSADECDLWNFTSTNVRRVENFISYANNTFEETGAHSSFIESLYQISHMWYIVFGVLLSILLAITVSCVTGNADVHETSPKFVAPYIRPFYWTKEELDDLNEDSVEVDSFSLRLREYNGRNCVENKKSFDNLN